VQDSLAFRPPRGLIRLFQVLAIAGAVTFAVALFRQPQRAWVNGLLVCNYLVWLAVGGLVLIALDYVGGARWSEPLRRLQQALVAVLPIAGVGLLAVLLFRPSLYSGPAQSTASEEHVSSLATVWLARPFFLARALIYLGVWLAFAMTIFRNSRQAEQTGDQATIRKNIRLSAGFLVAFGVTCWLASYDWIMSLEPDWSSTVFGVYNFAGTFLSALAAVTLLAVTLKQTSPLRAVLTADRLHNLGTLLFAFSSFWMYTWYCQYLLIWYTNHPDETIYYLRRGDSSWRWLMLANLLLNWGIPFSVLLLREAKRCAGVLGALSVIILAGRWLDLYLMIVPSQKDAVPWPGALEAGVALGALGILGLAIFWVLARLPLIPVHHGSIARSAFPDGGRGTDMSTNLGTTPQR
jgi:hypothetical protein